jgi:pilus assembly protein FimV
MTACRLPLFLFYLAFGGAAQAAELGEARVSSFIGQPLVADIELTMLEDAGTPVAVRLAHPNVYHGANIGMPEVASSLTMSVMRRDGRQFLHVTSLKPVDAAHLHLYLELADGAQRGVRLATLWLSPDPHPAPPAPPPVPVAPPIVAKAAAAQPDHIEKPAPAMVPAPVRARPKPVVSAAPRKVEPVPAQPVVAPAPAPVAAACTPRVQPEANACVALGAKNALLREQLGTLEDKVKLLQVALGAAPASVVPPLKPYKPKKKVEPAPEAGTPWLLIGGAVAAVAALAAGVLLALRRKNKPKAPAKAPKAGLSAGLRARLGARVRGGKAVEPALKEGAHNSSTQL